MGLMSVILLFVSFSSLSYSTCNAFVIPIQRRLAAGNACRPDGFSCASTTVGNEETTASSSSLKHDDDTVTNDDIRVVEGEFSSSILKDAWGREPLLIRNAFSLDGDDAVCWPSWDLMMEEIALEEDITSRIIRHTPGDVSSFSLDVGPFESSSLEELLQEEQPYDDEKWTLVVNDVDRFHPPLSDWMDRTFSFIPKWRRDDAQVSLAPKGGGIGPHVDNYDVFLLQTSGTRQWQVGLDKISAQDELEATIPDLAVRILNDWDNRRRSVVSLQPGDLLYLPPRFAHCGTALSEDCMTLSVGCRAPSGADLVARVAESLATATTDAAVARYQDADLLQQAAAKTTATTSELTPDVKDQMKQLVLNAVNDVLNDDVQFDALLGCLVTESVRSSDEYYPLPLDEIEWREELGVWGNPQDAVELVCNGDGALYRAEGISAAYSRVVNPDTCELSYSLFMNGRLFSVPNVTLEEECAIRELLEAIVSAHPAMTADTLAPLSHQPAVMDLLETLVQQGLLYGSNEDEEDDDDDDDDDDGSIET